MQQDTAAPDSTTDSGESAPRAHRTLSQQLQDLLESLEGRDTTLGALVDAIGERGFGLLLAVLSLPAALPLPAPGYATPFGLLMIGLGAQMVRGRHHPLRPQVARRRVIRYSSFARTLRGAGLPLKAAEMLVRPRLSSLARSRTLIALIGLVIIALSAFMAIPIPLTNTLPSFAIFLLACGLLERDGLLLLAGLLVAPLAAGIAVLALYLGYTYGIDFLEGGLRSVMEKTFGSGS